MYTKLSINDKEYELKLTARACVDLEEELGANPLTIFMSGLPKMKDLMIFFKYALQVNEDPYELYDQYIAAGHSFAEFLKAMMDVLKSSGFMQDTSSKNA